MEDMENLKQVLDDFAFEFRQQICDKIVAENAVASGDLLNSIDCKVEMEDDCFVVYLYHADYFHYVNENTVPHWAPYDSTEKTFPQIEKWVGDKPLNPYPDSRGKLPTIKQVTFLVARKIAQEGTKGHYFFEATFNGLYEKYYHLIVDAIYKDIEKDLQGLI